MQHALMTLVAVLALGVGAQWLAWRIRIPSIVILLITGFLAGPVFGFIDPDSVFDQLLIPIVSISVAIILFEGGLSLKFSDLSKIAGAVRNLITTGIIVTWILSTWAAWYFLKFELSLAVLLGAILVVSGPTVIVPMVRSLRLSGKMGSILKWEAMLNDPIGAVLSVLVFEAIIVGGFGPATGQVVFGVLKTVLSGSLIGVGSAILLTFLLRRYLVPDFLESAVTLMMVTIAFTLSNYIQAESGLVTVTIMGILLANQKQVEISRIVEFKENLRVLLIASLFIVLAARMKPAYFSHLGLSSIAFVAFMFFIVRPLAVMASRGGSKLSVKECLFLSWVAPRGIVAAAVSSVFALELGNAGFPQADRLVAATFLVIVSTVIVYGMTAPWVARWTGVTQENPKGILILGAHFWARRLALTIEAEGCRVLLLDSNIHNVESAKEAGLQAVQGNILSKEFINQLDLAGIGRLMAITSNNEVNTLAAVRFDEIFGREGVYQLSVVQKKDEKRPGLLTGRTGNRILFGREHTFGRITEMFQKNAAFKKIKISKNYSFQNFKEEYGSRAVPFFIVAGNNDLQIITADQTPQLNENQSLIVLCEPPHAEHNPAGEIT